MPIEFRRLWRLASDHENYSYIFRGDECLLKRKRDLIMKVLREFEKRFNPSPDEEVYVFFVPGRVEVFGKHTDYAGGHSILFALDRGFFCISRVNDLGMIRIRDINPIYGERVFKVSDRLEPPIGDWGNYPMTVVKRLCMNFGTWFKGVDIVFGSDLPVAGGMSGSSALMIMTFLAFAVPNSLFQDPNFKENIRNENDLAMYLACIENGRSFKGLAGERGVGTFGGSEDHTIIIAGKRGRLSVYRFSPIIHKAEITMPSELSFIILYSGVKAEKTGEARYWYNLASRRAKLAVRRYNDFYGTRHTVLRDIIDENKGLSFEDLMSKVERATANYVERGKDLDLPGRFKQFYMEDRMIIPEAVKAFTFRDYEELGRLCDLSHKLSKQYLWNIVEEIDFLQRESMRCGALASSGFGAGFGGSAYAIVERERSGDFIKKLEESYSKHFPKHVGEYSFFETNTCNGAIELFTDTSPSGRGGLPFRIGL